MMIMIIIIIKWIATTLGQPIIKTKNNVYLLKKLNDSFRLVIVVIELSVIAYLIMIACG